MPQYEIKKYQQGLEVDQARIGIDVAKKWIWPYAYNSQQLLRIHSQPDFDPDTRLYCFRGDQMFGYMFTDIQVAAENEPKVAIMDFPRMAPGHEAAAELLIAKAFDMLRQKKVEKVTGRVTTMCPGDIKLAEKTGFTIYDWGYKVYYAYEMKWGKLAKQGLSAMKVDPDCDLDAVSEIASIWYKRPAMWCSTHLAAWHEEGVITHVGIRKQAKWVAACMAAPNDLQPTIAAIFYIYTPDEDCLKPMLAEVVNACVEYGMHTVIADLINEHRQYETVYKQMGFTKVADWAQCEKLL